VKNIDKSFNRAVWSEGFEFENAISVELEKEGWDIEPNIYFNASADSIIREYDIRSSKNYTHNGVEFRLALLIECKFNHDRLVFYARKARKIDGYPLKHYIGKDVESKGFNFKSIQEVFNSLHQYGNKFFPDIQVFGYQAFKKDEQKTKKGKKTLRKTVFKRNDCYSKDSVHKAIRTVSDAVTYERALVLQKPSDYKNVIYIWFPVVVFSGNLYRAMMHKRKTVSKKGVFGYRTGAAVDGQKEPMQFYVHIIDKQSLHKTLRQFNQLYKKFKQYIKTNIKP